MARLNHALLIAALILGAPLARAASPDEAQQVLAREMLAELVAINTSVSGGPGQTKKAAEAVAARLKAAGFADSDIEIAGVNEGDGNLLAWYRSPKPKARPVLLMAHIDVVDAVASDWLTDPWTLTEKDGKLYGRGALDIKNAMSTIASSFIRLKGEGFVPDRDLVIFFTADEETAMVNTDWLTKRARERIDPEFAFNGDQAFVDRMADGKARAIMMQTAEKLYATFKLEAKGLSRHSSLVSPDNAIYKLAKALTKVQAMEFPRELNETTRAYFKAWAPLAPPELRAGARALAEGRANDPAVATIESQPEIAAMLRTTCVATMLDAGIGENTLAPSASATVNCRILPQSSGGAVETMLRELVRADGVTVTATVPAVAAPASPLTPTVVRLVEAAARDVWPKIPLVPFMSPSASDGMFTRNAGIPTYGVRGALLSPEDFKMHETNEYIRVDSFNKSVTFWYHLIRRTGTL